MKHVQPARWLVLPGLMLCCPAVFAQNAAVTDQALQSYLTANWQTPEDYIIGKFDRYDIVFVGELHRIRHDAELIQHLIPRLHAAGIHNLGLEFARYADQADVDRLITAPTYDEALAREIQFKQFVAWGYQEYMDLYRVAWTLNQSLPATAPRFRIVALGPTANWPAARENMSEEELNRVVWGGRSPDEQMADVILKEFVDQGKKALIYSGTHHAFTVYRQPVYDFAAGRFIKFREHRMGNVIHDRIPDKVFNVMLHAPWPSKSRPEGLVIPMHGVIDRVMARFSDQRVGFDLHGMPLGALPDDRSLYSAGYEHFTLSTIADGYVFQRQLDDYEGVTVDDQFITAANIEEAIRNIPNVRARRPMTPADMLNNMRRDADMRFRFRIVER